MEQRLAVATSDGVLKRVCVFIVRGDGIGALAVSQDSRAAARVLVDVACEGCHHRRLVDVHDVDGDGRSDGQLRPQTSVGAHHLERVGGRHLVVELGDLHGHLASDGVDDEHLRVATTVHHHRVRLRLVEVRVGAQYIGIRPADHDLLANSAVLRHREGLVDHLWPLIDVRDGHGDGVGAGERSRAVVGNRHLHFERVHALVVQHRLLHLQLAGDRVHIKQGMGRGPRERTPRGVHRVDIRVGSHKWCTHERVHGRVLRDLTVLGGQVRVLVLVTQLDGDGGVALKAWRAIVLGDDQHGVRVRGLEVQHRALERDVASHTVDLEHVLCVHDLPRVCLVGIGVYRVAIHVRDRRTRSVDDSSTNRRVLVDEFHNARGHHGHLVDVVDGDGDSGGQRHQARRRHTIVGDNHRQRVRVLAFVVQTLLHDSDLPRAGVDAEPVGAVATSDAEVQVLTLINIVSNQRLADFRAYNGVLIHCAGRVLNRGSLVDVDERNVHTRLDEQAAAVRRTHDNVVLQPRFVVQHRARVHAQRSAGGIDTELVRVTGSQRVGQHAVLTGIDVGAEDGGHGHGRATVLLDAAHKVGHGRLLVHIVDGDLYDGDVRLLRGAIVSHGDLQGVQRCGQIILKVQHVLRNRDLAGRGVDLERVADVAVADGKGVGVEGFLVVHDDGRAHKGVRLRVFVHVQAHLRARVVAAHVANDGGLVDVHNAHFHNGRAEQPALAIVLGVHQEGVGLHRLVVDGTLHRQLARRHVESQRVTANGAASLEAHATEGGSDGVDGRHAKVGRGDGRGSIVEHDHARGRDTDAISGAHLDVAVLQRQPEHVVLGAVEHEAPLASRVHGARGVRVHVLGTSSGASTAHANEDAGVDHAADDDLVHVCGRITASCEAQEHPLLTLQSEGELRTAGGVEPDRQEGVVGSRPNNADLVALPAVAVEVRHAEPRGVTAVRVVGSDDTTDFLANLRVLTHVAGLVRDDGGVVLVVDGHRGDGGVVQPVGVRGTHGQRAHRLHLEVEHVLLKDDLAQPVGGVHTERAVGVAQVDGPHQRQRVASIHVAAGDEAHACAGGTVLVHGHGGVVGDRVFVHIADDDGRQRGASHLTGAVITCLHHDLVLGSPFVVDQRPAHSDLCRGGVDLEHVVDVARREGVGQQVLVDVGERQGAHHGAHGDVFVDGEELIRGSRRVVLVEHVDGDCRRVLTHRRWVAIVLHLDGELERLHQPRVLVRHQAVVHRQHAGVVHHDLPSGLHDAERVRVADDGEGENRRVHVRRNER